MLTKPVDIYFYSHMSFETWDFTNPTSVGIGGSETSHIEMSARLAARGYKVTSYAPVPWGPDEGAIVNRSVAWHSYKKATFKEPGLWIIYRYPEALDNFSDCHPDQEIWYVAQDVWYGSLTEDRGKKIDKYICLCEDHASYTARKYPFVADRIAISSNGISLDKIARVECENIVRNPKRLIWTSSPDRGLDCAINVFKRALEYIPDLELHIFYGFNNIDKFIELTPGMKALKEFVKANVDGVHIFWHGRMGQYDIIREFLKSGIWCYPTEVTETSCITCMEAQALGAVPITNPRWGLRSNVYHGILLEGHVYTDKFLQAAFTGEIVRLIQQPQLAEAIRKEMMPHARKLFDWENFVTQWEVWLNEVAN